MSFTYGKASLLETVDGLLDLFVYVEQRWSQWDRLEESIAEVDYKALSNEELEWFVDFLFNACSRVRWSTKEKTPYNEVSKKENDCFFIKNYNWKAFKFSKQKGVDDLLTTNYIVCIPTENLSESEIRWLESKCK